MSITDPIADALTLVRNASLARKEKVDLKQSKSLLEIVGILKREGFIRDFRQLSDTKQGHIRIYLKYGADGQRAINGIRRISKPGKRVYVKKGKLPRVLGGLGIAILTTCRGIMTDTEARRQNLGGEIICYVW